MSPAGSPALRDRIRERALALGFDRVRFTEPRASEHMDHYRRWIDEGAHGEMGYLAREDSVARRGDLRLTMADVRSVVLVTHNYYQQDPPGLPEDASRAVIARYARGSDYHGVMKKRLKELLARIEEDAGQSVSGRVYVDTGPILERELATRAGFGWLGKNTMLIHPRSGSYFFLGVLLLDLLLPEGPALHGRPLRQLPELPRCLSDGGLAGAGRGRGAGHGCSALHLLSHDRAPRPHTARAPFAHRQSHLRLRHLPGSVPVEREVPAAAAEAGYRARLELDGPPLVELAERLLSLDDAAFSSAFRGSPLKRARRAGLLRNVCVGLGNWGEEDAVPVLKGALQDDEPLVRGHAAMGTGAHRRLARSSFPRCVRAATWRKTFGCARRSGWRWKHDRLGERLLRHAPSVVARSVPAAGGASALAAPAVGLRVGGRKLFHPGSDGPLQRRFGVDDRGHPQLRGVPGHRLGQRDLVVARHLGRLVDAYRHRVGQRARHGNAIPGGALKEDAQLGEAGVAEHLALGQQLHVRRRQRRFGLDPDGFAGNARARAGSPRFGAHEDAPQILQGVAVPHRVLGRDSQREADQPQYRRYRRVACHSLLRIGHSACSRVPGFS